jgi:hypothetical protein
MWERQIALHHQHKKTNREIANKPDRKNSELLD